MIDTFAGGGEEKKKKKKQENNLNLGIDIKGDDNDDHK